jgi:hypothetical protein
VSLTGLSLPTQTYHFEQHYCGHDELLNIAAKKEETGLCPPLHLACGYFA